MRWVVIGVAALLVGLLSYGVAQQDSDGTAAAAKVRIGGPPPEAETALPALGEDATGSLADYRGQVVLVNFWASWCTPCSSEAPLLEATQQRVQDEGATVVGVSSRDASEDALGFIDEFGLTFPNFHDGSGDFADEWGTIALPESFVIGRDGRVAAQLRGEISREWIDKQFVDLVERS